MIIYYRDTETAGQGALIATHEDSQSVPASVYGDNVKSFVVSSGDDLIRIGELPSNNPGGLDNRPIKVVVPSLADDKTAAKKTVLDIISAASSGILSQYPQSEVLSWPTKEAAAKIYLDKGELTPTQKTLLDAEFQAVGSGTMDDLCATILLNAEKFSKISGFLAGLRQNTNAKIDAASSASALPGIIADMQTALGTELAKL